MWSKACEILHIDGRSPRWEKGEYQHGRANERGGDRGAIPHEGGRRVRITESDLAERTPTTITIRLR